MIEKLQAIVGVEHVLSSEQAAPYLKDWRGRYAGTAEAVVFPVDTAQVAAVVTLCAKKKVAIVPQGGNTSLCGGSVPLNEGRQVVVNLSRMNKILDVDASNHTMTVQAGCTLLAVRATAEFHNCLFPLGLTAIAEHCEIGGNISTNAGGISVLRYGSMRDMVLGLEVVMPDGRIWNGLRSLRKDNTGYDLKQLFIGAEGTLGIVTAAVLKLQPRPQTTVTAMVAVGNVTSATRLLELIREGCGNALSGFELMSRNCIEMVLKHVPDVAEPFDAQYPWYLLIHLSDVSKSVVQDTLRNTVTTFTSPRFDYQITADAKVAEKWWKIRRNISEAQKREGLSIKHDVSVPVSRVAQFILHADASLKNAYPGVRILAFGHMGDGNIHYNVSLSDKHKNILFIAAQEHNVNKLVYEVIRELGGSISAEHGIGQLKRDTIRDYKDPVELELMRTIKRALDPQGLMNPGKVI
ncbi:MAG: FAD-binding oxidoreductase [Gallionella sp.]|nr:FAD-binding oxidoreductase [Gallionella sp.]